MSWTCQRNNPWRWWDWGTGSSLSRARKCEADCLDGECWAAATYLSEYLNHTMMSISLQWLVLFLSLQSYLKTILIHATLICCKRRDVNKSSAVKTEKLRRSTVSSKVHEIPRSKLFLFSSSPSKKHLWGDFPSLCFHHVNENESSVLLKLVSRAPSFSLYIFIHSFHSFWSGSI